MVAEVPTLELEVAQRVSRLVAALPRQGPLWIFTHDYPDPDALASAGALHLLLDRHLGRHSQIVFTGMTERAENRLMAKQFRYRCTPTDHVRTGRQRMTASIFVDCQPWAGNISLPAAARPVAVFDHHSIPRKAKTEGLFLDVRPGVGATASILWEYLDACDIPVPPWLATCLCYAIITETSDFTRPFNELDRRAYLALLSKADLQRLGRIRNAPFPRDYFSTVQEAIARTRLYGRIAWTHISEVPNPEVVPEVADRLIRLERTTWSFCTGLMGGTLIVSLRSIRREARCDRILRSVFRGEGSAGGHDRMAAGSLDLSHRSPEEREDRTRELTRQLLRRLDPRHALRDDEETLESRTLTPVGAEPVEPVVRDQDSDPASR